MTNISFLHKPPSARLALHLAAATTELPGQQRSVSWPAGRLWQGWMTIALLAVASTALAVGLAWVLRRAL